MENAGLRVPFGALVMLRGLQAGAIAAPAFAGVDPGLQIYGLAATSVVALRGVHAVLRSMVAHRVRTAYIKGASEEICAVSALVPGDDAHEQWFFRGQSAAQYLIVDGYPALLANVAVGAVLGPLLVARFPLSAAVAGGVMAGFVLVAYFVVGQLHARAIERSLEDERRVVTSVAALARGHADLLASGQAPAHLAALGREAASWSDAQRRATLLGGLAGQMPALLFVAVAAFAWLQINTVAGFWSGAGDLVLFAAVGPAIVGLALGLVRARTEEADLAAFLRVLDGPLDPALTSTGRLPPDTDGDVVMDGVAFTYGRGTVIEGVSLRWRSGEIVVVRGANGTGKSTLLRLLVRLGDPIEGSVLVGEQDLRELDIDAWRGAVAYASQDPYFPPAWTVRDALRSLAPAAVDADLQAWVRRVELTRGLDFPLNQLSAGERQRVVIARVFASPRPFVILDEPEADLDAAGVAMLVGLLSEQRSHRRILVAAHNPAVVAVADAVVTLGSHGGSAEDRIQG